MVDVGLSVRVYEELELQDIIGRGTPIFAAPELANSTMGTKSDNYGLSAIGAALLSNVSEAVFQNKIAQPTNSIMQFNTPYNFEDLMDFHVPGFGNLKPLYQAFFIKGAAPQYEDRPSNDQLMKFFLSYLRNIVLAVKAKNAEQSEEKFISEISFYLAELINMSGTLQSSSSGQSNVNKNKPAAQPAAQIDDEVGAHIIVINAYKEQRKQLAETDAGKYDFSAHINFKKELENFFYKNPTFKVDNQTRDIYKKVKDIYISLNSNQYTTFPQKAENDLNQLFQQLTDIKQTYAENPLPKKRLSSFFGTDPAQVLRDILIENYEQMSKRGLLKEDAKKPIEKQNGGMDDSQSSFVLLN